MVNFVHARRRAGAHRALLAAFACVLLLSGLLGIVHRVVHIPGVVEADMQRSAASCTDAHGGRADRASVASASRFADLFGDHTDAECRLYDQLADSAITPTLPVVLLPMPLPTVVLPCLKGETHTRRIAFFEARGPPSSR